MSKNLWLVVALVAVIVVIGVVVSNTGDRGDTMMESENAGEEKMMEKEIDSMMEKEDTVMEEKEAMMEKDEIKDEMMAKPGFYETYAPEKVALHASISHDVVLFFRASWCPTCRAVDADIKTNLSKIPSSLAILDVDYDNSTALKQKYGVTYQHTFVQVDKDGNLIKKWSGSPTLSALVSEVQ